MKKIIIMACGLTFYSNIFAAQQIVSCPLTLTCNYEAGTCVLPPGNWTIEAGGASEAFSTVSLTGIASSSNIFGYGQKRLFGCVYQYKHSEIDMYIYVKNLVGSNWSFSGFGNGNGVCRSISDPTQCAAVIDIPKNG